MGDIHGAFLALKECLEMVQFDYDRDLLVQIGDIADGAPQVYECVEELIKIRKLVAIRGNHDNWLAEFIRTDYHPYNWNYGGRGTLISYLGRAGKEGKYFQRGKGYKTALSPSDIPEQHRDFFLSQSPYLIDEKVRCFVHGGFDRSLPIEQQDGSELYYNRSLFKDAVEHQLNGEPYIIKDEFTEIFIGHTPTQNWDSDVPMKKFNIYNVDTGAGHEGKLTIMDIDTKEYWQSRPIPELYGNYVIRDVVGNK